MLDVDGLFISRARLLRDRPDVYHPPAGATAEQVAVEQEMIEKAYQAAGVDGSCKRVQQ